MRRSAGNLRLPLDTEAVCADVEALLARTGEVDALLRVLVTRGGHRVALIEPLPDLPEAMRLALVTYAPTRILDGIKSLSYAGNMLAGRLARERGFDEALLVTPHGRVLEAPTSSFFWARDGVLRTPPLDDHILESITRDRVMQAVEVREEPCTFDDLRAADEAFLASTVREVLPVAAIEDVELAVDGPLTREAGQRTRALIEAELEVAPAGG
jgi:branched-chain amino acid aminotransferase